MKSPKEKLHAILSGLVLITLWSFFIAALSLPMLVHTFGFADDFIAWRWYTSAFFDPLKNVVMRDGRFLLGFIREIGYGHWTELEEFVWFRVICVVGWGAFSAALCHWILPKTQSRPLRILLTCACVLNPATGVFIAYSVCFPYSWAAFFGLVAGMLAVDLLRQIASWRKRIGMTALAVCLIIVAHSIYQPVAFFFFLPLLVHAQPLTWKQPWKDSWIRACALFGTATVIYGSIHLLIQTQLDPTQHRSEIGGQALEKVTQFGYFVWKAAESWTALAPAWISIPFALGVLGFSAFGSWRRATVVIALLTLVATVALPIAVTKIEFFVRILIVTYPVLAYLCVVGFVDWSHRLHIARATKRFAFALAFAAVISSFTTLTYLGLVKSSVQELAWMEEEASKAEEPIELLYFVMSWNRGQGQSWPGRELAEYGRAVAIVPDNAKPMISYAHFQRFPNKAGRRLFPGELVILRTTEFEALVSEGKLPHHAVVWRGDEYSVK